MLQRPKFSIIIPAYNCAEYIGEAIESVVYQTIGFEDNVQLVIVNDGSTDSTAMICEAYRSSFPGNIQYIEQENAGASEARKRGLQLAKGEFVNFLDADDRWSETAFACAERMFDTYPDMPFCAARHVVFRERRKRQHQLSFKFQDDALIDVTKVHAYPILSINNVLFRRSCLDEDLFDSRLSIGEDAYMVNMVLLRHLTYGVMSEPIYWYRKRDEGSSAIDSSTSNPSYYKDTPSLCHARLFAESKRRYGKVLSFLQYTVMYELQYRIKSKFPHPLSDRDLASYRTDIAELLADIDDSVIAEQRNIGLPVKLLTLALKHGLSFTEAQGQLRLMNKGVYFIEPESGAMSFFSSKGSQSSVVIESIAPHKGYFRIEGRLSTIFPLQSIELVAHSGDKVLTPRKNPKVRFPHRAGVTIGKAELYESPIRESDSFFVDDFHRSLCFSLVVPMKTTRFDLLLNGEYVTPSLYAGKFCPLSFRAYGHAEVGGKCLWSKGGEPGFVVSGASATRNLKQEALFAANAWINDKDARPLVRYRVPGLIPNVSRKRKVWLISDRTNMAGDNGEALFSYLMNHPVADVQPYFVISSSSSDYARLKKIGPVVPYKSKKHLKLQLAADCVISSAADEHVINLFGKESYLFLDRADFKFVFLQHGITLNDVSSWLNARNKNIALFVTAATRERDSIVGNEAYGYGSERVVLTGFPRHDKLLRIAESVDVERKITIAPTWRADIAGKIKRDGTRAMNPSFESTDYYLFFQSLLNSERLHAAAREKGYVIDFLIHPALVQEAHKFSSEYAKIVTKYDYPNQLSSTAIMVTDWSSVSFDFALLEKPLIYAQFDQDIFYERHSWAPGYFSYQDDGFGEVTTTLEDTVNAIIKLMDDPVMPTPYRKRVQEFFYTPPEGSSRCKAVVDAILALS